MARRTQKKKTPWLPPEFVALIRSGLVMALGLAVILCALLGLLSLASFHPEDPAWNFAKDSDAVHNILGHAGAFFADFMLQVLGAAAVLPCLIVGVQGAWSAVGRWYQRSVTMLFALWLLTCCVAVMSAATVLAALPWVPPHWPLISLGGGLGVMLHNALKIAATWTAQAQAVTHGVGLAVVACIMIFSTIWSMSLSPRYVMGWCVDKVRLAVFYTTSWAMDLFSREPLARSAPQPIATKSTRHKVSVTPRKAKPETGKRASDEKQPSLNLFSQRDDDFDFPSLSLLQSPKSSGAAVSSQALQKNAEILQGVLSDFGVEGAIVQVHPGPVVTLYEMEPAPGIKSSRVIGLADDIARSMSAVSVRVAVVPGRSVIGIELPNKSMETVYLQELLASKDYEVTNASLPLILGKDISGKPVIADLSKMPHLLVAGTTGSGKSVGVNAMILSLLYRMTPEQCRLIMIDPKMLELSVYNDIPHLLTPVVTDPQKAIVSLKWAVREMEDRYRAMSLMGVRNLAGYNQKIRQAVKRGEILTRRVQTGFDVDTGKPVFEEQPMDMTELPHIVIVVDEFADLMLVAGKEVEAAIQRLAQMARAAGLHLIMATQRPSVDVITGTIKANFPSRISYQVTSKIDSRTILGEGGAENLLGRGDMLYMSGGGRLKRVHGAFVDDKEVEAVAKHLHAQRAPDYVDQVLDENATDFDEGSVGAAIFGGANNNGNKDDELYDKALAIVAAEQKASTSFVQRHLSIGYNRAAKIIERMEKDGVISAANHVGKRQVLIPQRDYAA